MKIFYGQLAKEDSIAYVREIAKRMEEHNSEISIVQNIADCDVIFLGGPLLYFFDFDLQKADQIKKSGKPIITFQVAEGYPNRYEETFPFYTHFLEDVQDKIRVHFWRDLFKSDKDNWNKSYPLETIEMVQETSRFFGEPSSKSQFFNRPYNIFMATNCFNDSRTGFFRIYYGEPDSFVDNILPEARLPFEEILKYHGNSKISLSLEGSGFKCGRHHEASLNSVMATPDVDIIWSFPWIDGLNCIGLPYTCREGRFKADVILGVLKMNYYLNDNPDLLYNIYRTGFENAKNYYFPYYYGTYLPSKIKEYL